MANVPKAEPFFEIVMAGLAGEVDGENFWDAVAEDAVFEFAYKFPGLPQILSKAEYAEWFKSYPNVLEAADNLHVYRDTAQGVTILDYEVHGTAPTGRIYNNRFCSIVKIRGRKIVRWTDFADTFSAFQAMNP